MKKLVEKLLSYIGLGVKEIVIEIGKCVIRNHSSDHVYYFIHIM